MNDFARSLAALRAKYAITLGARLEELADALHSAAKGDGGRLQEALSLAHKLHGTTGTYGFKGVSAKMGEVEDRLRSLQNGEESADSAWWAQLQSLVALAGGDARATVVQTAERTPCDERV